MLLMIKDMESEGKTMKELHVESIIEKIPDLNNQHFRLLLLVGPPGKGKTSALKLLEKKLNVPRVNVNLELSQRLLEIWIAKKREEVEQINQIPHPAEFGLYYDL